MNLLSFKIFLQIIKQMFLNGSLYTLYIMFKGAIECIDTIF